MKHKHISSIPTIQYLASTKTIRVNTFQTEKQHHNLIDRKCNYQHRR